MGISSLLDEKHIVNAVVRIGGERVDIVYLRLEQYYGDHHHFEIALDYDITGNAFMGDPLKEIGLIGRFATIIFRRGNDIEGSYRFKGVITEINKTGREGRHGYLVVKGSSPTIMLERGLRMDIYSDLTLSSLFKKVTHGVYSDYLEYVNAPTFENRIDFLMQYNESDWEFLRRVSYLYGENLFYSGSEIIFGAHREWDSVKMIYDKEITELRFCSRMLPNESVYYQYVADMDMTVERHFPESIDSSTSYLDAAAEQNKALTVDHPPKRFVEAPVDRRTELDELVKREKSRRAAETVYVAGKAKTFDASLGRVIRIRMPEGMSGTRDLGSYRVIKSIHVIDENHRYVNEFEAVPASLGTMPVRPPRFPVADSVLASVTSNDDPKGLGRVQVDFPFANHYCRIWMRVMSPGAGMGDSSSRNRGLVFIPEKGDQVMVGFEYGDPNRPYVMGSMFHAGNGSGGGANNSVKSIITRSGVKVVFDDDRHSLHIEDPSGNTWDMDGKGNISVNAPGNLSVCVGKNMNVSVGKNVFVNAGESVTIDAGQNINETAGGDILQSALGSITESADNKSEMIEQRYQQTAEKGIIKSDQITAFSNMENIVLQSGKTVKANSAEKSNMF